MNQSRDLDRIALADVTLDEARRILQTVLAAASPELVPEIVASLRSWAWKALTARRSDQELEGWHELLRRVAARLEDLDAGHAARVELLAELIHESIVSADMSSPDFVLQRSHTRAMLGMVAGAADGRMDREQIGSRLSLQQANLTRVLNMLVAAGLVTKATEGKRVVVEITRAGQREAERLRLHKPPVELRDTVELGRPVSPERIEALVRDVLRFLGKDERNVEPTVVRAERAFRRHAMIRAVSANRVVPSQGQPVERGPSLASSCLRVAPTEKPAFDNALILALHQPGDAGRFRANVFPELELRR